MAFDADFWLMSAHHYTKFYGQPLDQSRADLNKLMPGDFISFMTSDAPRYAATGLLRPAESGQAEVIDVSRAHRRVLAKITTGMVQTHAHKLRCLMVVEIGFDYITGVTPRGDDHA